MSNKPFYTIFGVRFYPQHMKRAETGLIVLDLIMLLLVSVNILLFILYFAYNSYRLSQFFATELPHVHQVLQPIYEAFPFIDLLFVSVFLLEFVFRWVLSIIRKTYHRWFFYPFIHWYDLLGSLPFGSFRFLRILRIVSVVGRLQRTKVIDIRHTYLYSRYRKYRSIIVEEITDKVILNVTDGFKEEIQAGLPITDRLFREVIQPNKPVLVQWLSKRLQTVTASSFRIYQHDLEVYVDERIKNAVKTNPELGQLKRIPVLGGQVANMIERAIQDIVYQVLTGIIQDVAAGEHTRFLDEFSDVAIATILREDQKPENEALNQIITRMSIEVLEIIQERVRIQEWKLQQQAEAEGFDLIADSIADDQEQDGIIPPLPEESMAD